VDHWVLDVGDRDFESAVIERSREIPVVVDLWAPWCGPCRTLGPLLERLAEEQAGGFILAKGNIDENPGLAQALRVQSVPMVLGFRNGQVVTEFVGALPESAVREWLARVLPSPAEGLAAEGEALATGGKVAEAESTLRQALALDARCDRALLGLAGILAARGESANALDLLDRVAPGPLRPSADRLAAEVRIREAGGGDEHTLRAMLAAKPADLETRLLLGHVLAAGSKYGDALEQYLEVVRRDRSFRDGAARKAMLDIFELLGPSNETVERYRSELAKVLFS